MLKIKVFLVIILLWVLPLSLARAESRFGKYIKPQNTPFYPDMDVTLPDDLSFKRILSKPIRMQDPYTGNLFFLETISGAVEISIISDEGEALAKVKFFPEDFMTEMKSVSSPEEVTEPYSGAFWLHRKIKRELSFFFGKFSIPVFVRYLVVGTVVAAITPPSERSRLPVLFGEDVLYNAVPCDNLPVGLNLRSYKGRAGSRLSYFQPIVALLAASRCSGGSCPDYSLVSLYGMTVADIARRFTDNKGAEAYRRLLTYPDHRLILDALYKHGLCTTDEFPDIPGIVSSFDLRPSEAEYRFAMSAKKYVEKMPAYRGKSIWWSYPVTADCAHQGAFTKPRDSFFVNISLPDIKETPPLWIEGMKSELFNIVIALLKRGRLVAVNDKLIYGLEMTDGDFYIKFIKNGTKSTCTPEDLKAEIKYVTFLR